MLLAFKLWLTRYVARLPLVSNDERNVPKFYSSHQYVVIAPGVPVTNCCHVTVLVPSVHNTTSYKCDIYIKSRCGVSKFPSYAGFQYTAAPGSRTPATFSPQGHRNKRPINLLKTRNRRVRRMYPWKLTA